MMNEISNYKFYSKISNVLCNPEERMQNMIPADDPKLGKRADKT